MSVEAPVEWAYRSLLECVKTIGGGTPSRKVLQYFDGSIPWLTVTDMPPDFGVLKTVTSARQAITKEALENSAAKIIPQGAVLFTTRVAVGKVAIAGRELATNQDFTSFVPIRDLDARFLGYYLLSTKSRLESLARGATVRGLPRRILESLMVPVPPLDEQRRIVGRIEELFIQDERVRELRDAALYESNSLWSALVNYVLSSTPADGWPEDTVGNLIGGTPQNGKSVRESAAGTVRCLKLSAMRDGTVDPALSKLVPLAEDAAAPYLLRPGDFLVMRGNGSKDLVGQAALVGPSVGRVIFPDLIIRIRPNESVLEPRFLLYYWNSSLMREQIEVAAQTAAGIWKINQRHIGSFRINYPPIEEQRRIVKYLDGMQTKVTEFRDLQDQTLRVLDALTPAILDSALNGRL